MSCFIETKLGLAMNEQGAEPALEFIFLHEEWEISAGSLQLLPAVSVHHPHLPPHPKRHFFRENFINTYVPQNADGQVTKWMHRNNCMGITGKNHSGQQSTVLLYFGKIQAQRQTAKCLWSCLVGTEVLQACVWSQAITCQKPTQQKWVNNHKHTSWKIF